MSDELAVRDDYAPIADDFLLQVADQAERRIDAVIKIKQVALKVTNARDWTDQNGNPYLQVSGSEKIANLFNISWRISEPQYMEEQDGHFSYSIRGTFSLGGRTIEVEGTRSSRDPFFNRYVKDANGRKTDQLMPPHTIDKGDVKKAALTNLYGNGITRMLGIRNLTWDDLEKFAGITKEMILNKVSYNQREAGEGREPIKQPQAKGAAAAPPKDAPPPATSEGNEVVGIIETVSVKTGKGAKGPWTKYGIKIGEQWYGTFDTKIGQLAESLKGQTAKVWFTNDGKYNTCTEIAPIEGAKTAIADPPDCPHDPAACSDSSYDQDGKANCTIFGHERLCPYQR